MFCEGASVGLGTRLAFNVLHAHAHTLGSMGQRSYKLNKVELVYTTNQEWPVNGLNTALYKFLIYCS